MTLQVVYINAHFYRNIIYSFYSQHSALKARCILCTHYSFMTDLVSSGDALGRISIDVTCSHGMFWVFKQQTPVDPAGILHSKDYIAHRSASPTCRMQPEAYIPPLTKAEAVPTGILMHAQRQCFLMNSSNSHLPPFTTRLPLATVHRDHKNH